MAISTGCRKRLRTNEPRIVAAEVRALCKQDLSTFKTQISQTKQADDFLRSKITNVQLYAWLKNELSTLYFQSYQLAYDMAKKAEIAYRHELGVSSASFVGFGHWDNLHKDC
ncbi:MAG: hypothetical protein IPI14_11390 [Polaromonas sp.]|nr:hypothetical protein [Polaromonas sp.]